MSKKNNTEVCLLSGHLATAELTKEFHEVLMGILLVQLHLHVSRRIIHPDNTKTLPD